MGLRTSCASKDSAVGNPFGVIVFLAYTQPASLVDKLNVFVGAGLLVRFCSWVAVERFASQAQVVKKKLFRLASECVALLGFVSGCDPHVSDSGFESDIRPKQGAPLSSASGCGCMNLPGFDGESQRGQDGSGELDH